METFSTRLSSCLSKHLHLALKTPKDISATTPAKDKALLNFFPCGESASEIV